MILIVGIGAFTTSALTAVVGFGGGMVLLALLLLVVDPVIAIPLHAAIQVVSNGTRTVVRRHDVDWRIVGLSSILLLPAGAATVPLARAAPATTLQAVIAVVILAATWIPERTSFDLRAPSTPGWIVTGGVLGALNPLVGATGPLVAPVFRSACRTRQSFVGTFAASQVSGHLAKIVLFGAAGRLPTGQGGTAIAGIAGVVVGTHVGGRFLDRLSEQRFRALYLAAITAVAGVLLLDTAMSA